MYTNIIGKNLYTYIYTRAGVYVLRSTHITARIHKIRSIGQVGNVLMMSVCGFFGGFFSGERACHHNGDNYITPTPRRAANKKRTTTTTTKFE